MLKIGLTGNFGSGKSTVATIFRCLNVPVYHADDEAKKMYLRRDVLQKTVSIAGKQILDPSGTLNRQALAEAAFSDPEILKALTRLIHPLVLEDFTEWSGQYHELPYVIQESAILFESGFRDLYDKVIHVSCPTDTAMKRVEKRDHLSPEMIRQRMQFQLSDQEKAALSDFVILNDDSILVIPQVLRVHRNLSERSA